MSENASESESESESEEFQMYCCLPFSYAVKYGLITIDYDRNSVEIPIRSSLSDNENKQLIGFVLEWLQHKTQLSIIQLNQRLNSNILSL
jgi:hypothetical protein